MSDARWPVLSTRPLELLVVSEATPWTMHFDNLAKRSRRCGGPRCAMCAMGSPSETVNVLMGFDANGTRWLFELRKRHVLVLAKMNSDRGTCAGWSVKVVKSGQAKNSPVEVSLLDWQRVEVHCIRALVESLGLPALLLESPSDLERQHEDSTSHGGTFTESDTRAR